MNNSVYKTKEKRDFFRAQYNGILSAFPFGQKYIETSYGQTFVLFSGAEDAPPVILLHGSCSNSVFMAPEMTALADSYRVYAVDIIGEAGNSDEHRLPLHTHDYADWLRDVLDALGIKNAVIIGNSLGGWIALKFAATFPERVNKLALLAPGGIAGQFPELLDKARNAQTNDEALTVESSMPGSDGLPKAVTDFMNLIFDVYYPITDELPVFTDEAIKKLTMPVLFVAGKLDNLLDSTAAAKRLGLLLPHAVIHLLENCGHMILNGPEFILPFLRKDSNK